MCSINLSRLKVYTQTTNVIAFNYLNILKPLRHVLTPHTSQRIADLTERDVILHTLNEQRHQIICSFGRDH